MAMRVWTITHQDWLDGRIDPPGLAGARAYLGRCQEAISILDCYQHFFPIEWAVSTATRLPTADQAWSDAEMEFFQLVSKHLFPICLECLEDSQEEGPEGRDLTLPIHPGGFTWWEETPATTRRGWRILCVLTGIWNPPGAIVPPRVAAVLAPVVGPIPDLSDIEQACANAPAPLAALPNALLMLDKNTETAWLNTNLETPMDLTWNRESVTFARDDYQAAKAILDQVTPFLAWLEKGVTPVRQLITVWEEARRLMQQPKRNRLPNRRGHREH
jgi:hypothetical protein